MSKVPNRHEVVMDTPRFDEGTLGVGDEGGHVRSKPTREHFGDELGDRMNETNRPEVNDALRPILLGKQHIFVELSQWRFVVCRESKRWSTAMRSSLTMAQHFLKNRPVKPSGPGALSLGMLFIASRTSSSVKGESSSCRSCDSRLSSSQLKFVVLPLPLFMTCEKWSWIIFSLALCSVTHP